MNTSIARILTGLGFITLGAVALLGSFGVLNFAELAGSLWPVAIIAAGVIMLISNPRNFVWALLVLVAGVAFLVRSLGYTDFNIFSLFWPAVLIAVGASILFRRSGIDGLEVSSKDREDATAVLSGINIKNTSDDYKGGNAVAILGGVSLDLRKAVIKKEAELAVTSFWGGVEVKVPENWVVRSRVNAIMGGVEIKIDNAEAKKGAPVLTIVGDVIMAGVEIKH